MLQTWVKKPQRVSLAFSGFTVAAGVLCLLMLHRANRLQPMGFFLEIQTLLAATVSLSVLNVFAAKRVLYFTGLALRFATLVALLSILRLRYPLVEMLIVLPFLVNVLLQLGNGWGSAAAVALIAAATAADLRGAVAAGQTLDLVALVAVYGLVTATAGLIIFYREKLYCANQRIAGLEDSVSDLYNANTAFLKYADSVENESTEQERNRITREIHDSFSYALVNIITSMKAARMLCGASSGELAELVGQTQEQAETALHDTRQTLHKLRAVSTHPQGLAALYHLLRAYSESTGIRAHLHPLNVPASFGVQLDSAIYRFIQEGLTNALRHGRATVIDVFLFQSGEDIQITVRDNGIGSATVAEGIGIRGMRERFSPFGGVVDYSNTVGGFALRVTIPFRRYAVLGQD